MYSLVNLKMIRRNVDYTTATFGSALFSSPSMAVAAQPEVRELVNTLERM